MNARGIYDPIGGKREFGVNKAAPSRASRNSAIFEMFLNMYGAQRRSKV